MAPLCLTFWGTARLFSKAGAPLHNPTSNVWGFQVLQIFTNIYCLFDSSHPSACKFLISLKTNDIKHLFHMLFDYLYIFFGEMFMQILCRGLVAQSCPTLWDPMDCVAHRTPLSMEFSMQEYWSRLPFPSPRDLHDLGIEPGSLVPSALAVWFFTNCPTWGVTVNQKRFASGHSQALKLRALEPNWPGLSPDSTRVWLWPWASVSTSRNSGEEGSGG